MKSSQKTILIASRSAPFVVGLQAILSRNKDYQLEEPITAQNQLVPRLAKLRPSMILLDMALGYYPNFSAIKDVRIHSKESTLGVFSSFATPMENFHALHAMYEGAQGYLKYDSSADEWLRACGLLSKGMKYIAPEYHGVFIDAAVGRLSQLESSPFKKLTDREMEVFGLIAQTYTAVEVGKILSITNRTAEAHVANIRNKLGIRKGYTLRDIAMMCYAQNPTGPATFLSFLTKMKQ